MKYLIKFKKQKIKNLYFIIMILFTLGVNVSANENGNKDTSNKSNLIITVVDSVNDTPIELVNLFLQEDNKTVKAGITDPHGTTVFRNVGPGKYNLAVHCIGYRDYAISIVVDEEPVHIKILMIPTSVSLGEVVVNALKGIHVSNYIDIKTGNQIVTTEEYHASPVSKITTLIQQNVSGAVRQPVGELVIRDQHNEYSSSSYYLDGVPVPLGVLGDMNEIINPGVIQRITAYTGGFPAEYGGQSAAVFDIQSKIPTNGFHLGISSYIGSYLTSDNGDKVLNSNGQSLSFSNSTGRIKYYLSGSRQETDRRLDQPVDSLFHDHGFDYFLYGKIDYILGENDFITSNLNYSNSETQIPYDPIEGTNFDSQNSYNAFQTLSYYHLFSTYPDHQSKILIALFSSERGLKYLTDYRYDETRQDLLNDSTSSYTVDQDRKYFTFGGRVKYTNRLSDQFEYETGLQLSLTNANESFYLKNFEGNGPIINSNFPSSNFGIFLQTRFNPLEAVLFEAGARYDQYISPSIPLQRQVSPRLKLSWFIDEANTFYLSYDRLFLPTNVEGFNYLSQVVGGSTLDSGTYPEKDNLYEAGMIHNFNPGLILKVDYFYKDALPGLDDESLGASSIKINVNIEKVKISGLEVSLDYNELSSPFSFYINGSVIHGYGQGLISGGFIPSEYAVNPFDLDHDQRLTLVTGLNYQQNNLFMNLVFNYGSGLTNGNDDYDFETGLFELNQGAHTTPAWIVNFSGGYIFNIGDNQTIQPSIYVTNLFDHSHLIKGAFFKSAYFEERRDVVFKLTYHL